LKLPTLSCDFLSGPTLSYRGQESTTRSAISNVFLAGDGGFVCPGRRGYHMAMYFIPFFLGFRGQRQFSRLFNALMEKSTWFRAGIEIVAFHDLDA